MKLRIILYVEKFLSKSETFIFNQVSYLNKYHDVLVLTDQLNKVFEYKDLKIITLNNPTRNNHLKRFLYNRYTFLNFRNKERSLEVNRIITSFKPDLIHCHFGIQSLKLIQNIKNVSFPIFITFHGYDVTYYTHISNAYVRSLRFLFRKNLIYPIFVCKFHRNYFRNLKIISKNEFILYNGVKVDYLKRKTYRKEKHIHHYTQIGRLVEKKGHEYIIIALSKFILKYPKDKIIYNIIGDGPLMKDLTRLVSDLDLENVVVFHQWLDVLSIKNVLEETDYYVHPSVVSRTNDMEATSIAILEAMSMELPIISTYHAGISEVVQNGINGIMVNEKNLDEYVTALKEIQNWGYLKINRKKIIDSYNLDTRNQKLINHYFSVFSKT